MRAPHNLHGDDLVWLLRAQEAEGEPNPNRVDNSQSQGQSTITWFPRFYYMNAWDRFIHLRTCCNSALPQDCYINFPEIVHVIGLSLERCFCFRKMAFEFRTGQQLERNQIVESSDHKVMHIIVICQWSWSARTLCHIWRTRCSPRTRMQSVEHYTNAL